MSGTAVDRQRDRSREYQRKMAADPAFRADRNERAKKFAESRRRFLAAVKQTCGCVDCGARPDDPRKLHFDHRPGTVKLFQLARACYSWPRMIAELEKCDVRCISCHSTRHWADKRSRP